MDEQSKTAASRTVDDVLRELLIVQSGRTRYYGQRPRDDELLADEIIRLRASKTTEPANATDYDPIRTAIYMRGWRNGMESASDLLDISGEKAQLNPGELLTAAERKMVAAVLRWKMDEIRRMADDEWKRVMENLS